MPATCIFQNVPNLDLFGRNRLWKFGANSSPLFNIRGTYIKEDKSILYDLLMADLFETGIQLEGASFKIAVLDMCGNAPFLPEETAHGDQKNPENQSVAHPHFPACPGPCLQDQEEHKDERHESP
jgi:hypothetical protein